MKKLLKQFVTALPFKVRRTLLNIIMSEASYEERIALGRTDTMSALYLLKKNGFNPRVVLDIGAHEGLWTKEVSAIYTESKFILFEPLPEKQAIIQRNCDPNRITLKNVLLGGEQKDDVAFFSMDSGSSVMEEMTSFSRQKIVLPMTTLQLALADENITTPFLMKLDVQGFELEVLKGAGKLLLLAEVICMEVSMLNYNSKAPLATEVIAAMKAYGFVLWDITGFFRKSTDNALIQADVIFIREDSPLRKAANNFLLPFKVEIN